MESCLVLLTKIQFRIDEITQITEKPSKNKQQLNQISQNRSATPSFGKQSIKLHCGLRRSILKQEAGI